MNEHHHSDDAVILQLPEAVVGYMLEYLPFADRRVYFSSCHSLWRSCQAYESLLQSLTLSKPPPPTVLSNFLNLRSLDVGSSATDDFLRSLESKQAVPRLKHLVITNSLQVTDAGLESLVRNPIRCETLETLDITYCRNTTYAGTFCLRDSLKALKLLRRQPEWMDGTYETPSDNGCRHTYWADGTFSASTGTLSSGHVSDYFQWTRENEDHVGDKLQYNNMDSFEVLPQELRNAYQPGVSMLRLPGERAVLVAQSLRGLYPPKNYPKLEQKRDVPLGECIYLDVDGKVLSDSDNEELRHVMISHIPIQPLAKESLMPPSDIVELNRVQVEKQQTRTLYREKRQCAWNTKELQLHSLLGGSLDELSAMMKVRAEARPSH